VKMCVCREPQQFLLIDARLGPGQVAKEGLCWPIIKYTYTHEYVMYDICVTLCNVPNVI